MMKPFIGEGPESDQIINESDGQLPILEALERLILVVGSRTMMRLILMMAINTTSWIETT